MRSWLHDLGIRPKLLGSFGIILLITMTLGVFAYRAAIGNDRASAQTLHTQEVIIEIENLSAALYEMRVGRSGFLLTGDTETLAPFNRGAADYPVILDRLETLTADNPEQAARWTQLEPMIDTWLTGTLTPSLDLRGDSDVLDADQQASIAAAVNASREQVLAMQAIINDALAEEQDLLTTRTETANRENARLKQTVIVGTIGALAVGIGLAFLIARELAGAMNQLTGLARHISRGNYGQRIAMHRRDEIGQTADALDQMAADLGQTVQHLETAVSRAELSEGHVSAILTSAAEGIVTVSRDGMIQSMNPAAERMFASSGSDSSARPFNTLLDAAALPGGAGSWFERLRPGDGDTQSIHEEAVGCRPDGTRFPIEVSMSRMSYDGETRFIVIIRDISERREAERRIRHQYAVAERARSINQAIFNSASEAMVLISPDLKIAGINARFAEFFAVDPDKVAGRPMREFGQAVDQRFADPTRFRAMLWPSVTETQSQFRDSFEQVWPEHRDLDLYSAPVWTQSGEHIGRLLAFRDVTHEREVDRVKTEFVSMVSHELRTPLTSIKGFVDLLLEGDAGELSDDQQGFLEIVSANADRLVSLINDILDISRIESGKMTLHREPVDLDTLLTDLVRSFQPQLQGKHQTITLQSSPDLTRISADPTRLTQVFANLISNAHKYTPNGGHIDVRVESDAAGARVSIADNGIGLSPEEQAQLFDRFYRARNRTTQTVAGTGLGLSITRSLVELHGGTISVESDTGQGSTFIVDLPRTDSLELEPDPGTRAPGRPAVLTSRGMRILLVEDEPDIAMLIRHYLERAGYDVHIAHTATDGVDLARRLVPALITLDVLLPDRDGFSVLELLKDDPATRNIPVVMLSMFPDDGKGKRLGAVDYLAKPIHEDALVQRIDALLRRPTARTILVADDDNDIRRLIVQRLNRVGYDTVEAADGREAVDQALAHDPGLILLDVKMPGMDGIAALAEIRRHRTVAELPVVMMTASPGVLDSDVSGLQHLGVTRLLQKPVSAEELAAIISRHLASPAPPRD